MAFDSSDTRQRRVGLFVLLIVFGGFGGWSVLAPLQEAALAPGQVMLEGNRKTIQHLEGGIVREILVTEGQKVSDGDLLVRLDDTQLRAQLDIALGQFYAVKAREQRLRAERDGLDAVVYPSPLAETEDPRALDAMAGQDQMLQARNNAYLGQVEVLQQRIEQLKAQARGFEGLQKSKQTLRASFLEEIADFDALLKEGYVDRMRLRELERSDAELEGEAAELDASIARVGMTIGETQLEILQLQKNLHSEVVNELGEVQSSVYDLEERVRALRDRFQQALIRSPVSGRVLGLAVHTQGGVIGPGEPLLYVVPEAENLIVEARVNPADIDRVREGQPADIRFTAFSSQTTPVIDGRVTTVSADVLVDEQSGKPYFLAQVMVTPKGRDMLGELVLVPGMPAEVLIQTGKRTLFQYMVQPISNSFARSMLER